MHSVFAVLMSCTVCLCMCLCMGQANNQEKEKMKTSQQENRMIGVIDLDSKPCPPACESTVLNPVLLIMS